MHQASDEHVLERASPESIARALEEMDAERIARAIVLAGDTQAQVSAVRDLVAEHPARAATGPAMRTVPPPPPPRRRLLIDTAPASQPLDWHTPDPPVPPSSRTRVLRPPADEHDRLVADMLLNLWDNVAAWWDANRATVVVSVVGFVTGVLTTLWLAD
jgi:hypothetical protein